MAQSQVPQSQQSQSDDDLSPIQVSPNAVYLPDPTTGTFTVDGSALGTGGSNCSAACQAMNKANASGGAAYATIAPGISPSGQSGVLSITWVDANGNLHDVGTFDSSTGAYIGGSSPAPGVPFAPNSPTAPYPQGP